MTFIDNNELKRMCYVESIQLLLDGMDFFEIKLKRKVINLYKNRLSIIVDN